MKKLVFTFATIGLFFGTAAHAQVYSESSSEAEVTTKQETTMQATTQEEYAQIEAAELPAAVSTAITRDFEGATTQEAWIKEKDGKTVYKLKLDVNGTQEEVYADAEGNWIDKSKK